MNCFIVKLPLSRMKYMLTFFLFFGAQIVQAQLQGQALIDSIDARLPAMKEDSNKVKAYSRISQIYYSVNPVRSFPYAETGLKLAEKIGWKRGIANISNNLGLFISDTGNYTLGRQYYEKSYELNKQLDSKPNQINNLNNIGRNYQFESDFTTAANYFFKALAIAEDLKSDEHIALVGTNLSSCFYRQKNYKKATEYAEFTLKHAKLAGSSRNSLNALMQLGTIRVALQDTAGSIPYFEQALNIAEETNNYSDMAKVLLNLSVTVYPDYTRAIQLMKRVDSIVSQINPGSEMDLTNSFNMAETYHLMARKSTGAAQAQYNKEALSWLAKATGMAGEGRPEFMVNALKLQGDLEEDRGEYKKSLESFKRSGALSDSLFSQDKKNEIAELEGQYKLTLKDKEIAINKLMLGSQRKTLWGLAAGILLLCVIGILLYRQNRIRQKTNSSLMVMNEQLDKANKVKAQFFSILSHDLRRPIVNLVHFLELQKEDPAVFNEQEQQMHRQHIGDSAANLLNTMEAMLLWSKEQMKRFEPVIKFVAVADLFDHIRNFFDQEKVEMEFTAEPGLILMTDENYLHTIMQNLTSNAIHSAQHSPDARIEWKAVKKERQIILSISDNGPGIAPEQAKILFDDRMEVNRKTGLGLYLIRDLAKAIKVEVGVESEPGKGTTFVLLCYA
ncbi:MAG: tetratricopeptide repeat-containing sensor histidine kinase [Chitinophagaceae bacterium]